MSPTDDELELELRRLVGDRDPVPAAVLSAGHAALGWRRLDAELAELLGDSALDPDELALVRGIDAPLRAVTFGTGQRTIDLDVVAHGAGWRLRGQLSPATESAVEAQSADGRQLAATRTDALGRFVLEVPGGGMVRLRVSEDPGTEPIETAWIWL